MLKIAVSELVNNNDSRIIEYLLWHPYESEWKSIIIAVIHEVKQLTDLFANSRGNILTTKISIS
jgi:hypothetical protein